MKGGINSPLPFTKACAYTAMRSIMTADVPNCFGYTRAIKVMAPEGTVMNPTRPFPCGARGITGYRMIDCQFGALAQAVPDKVTADNMGGSTLPTIAGWVDGKPYVFCETFMGTWGAAQAHDGQEGVPHMGANQSNVPVEMIETGYPLRIVRYGFVPDTGGAGKFRGGLSIVREFEMLADDAVLNVRSDKRRFPPHGLFGGEPGTPSLNYLTHKGKDRLLPALLMETEPMLKGDRFRAILAGGGGYGDRSSAIRKPCASTYPRKKSPPDTRASTTASHSRRVRASPSTWRQRRNCAADGANERYRSRPSSRDPTEDGNHMEWTGLVRQGS